MTLAAGTHHYDLGHLSGMIRRHADFPIAGIRFADIFPIFLDPLAVAALVDHLVERVGKTVSPETSVDIVVGMSISGYEPSLCT
jgi:adenine/guanine phosphoribosyltransferase-like PRPP-binding protein